MKKLFILPFLLWATLSYSQPVIVFDGNSLVAGVGSTYGHELPTDVNRILGNVGEFHNIGIPGYEVSQMLSAGTSRVDQAFYDSNNPSRKRVLVAWEFINELVLNGTPVDRVFAIYKQYCLDRKTQGWKVIAMTAVPAPGRGDGQAGGYYEVSRNTFNGWLRAEWQSFADALADVGDIPNLTYYDGTHLDDAGYLKVAQVAAPIVQKVVNGETTLPVKFKKFKVVKFNVFLVAILALSLMFSACKKEILSSENKTKVKVEWEAESNGATYTVEASKDGKEFFPVATSHKDSDTLVLEMGANYYRIKGEENGSVYYTDIQLVQ